jgi:hypothetical protein
MSLGRVVLSEAAL